jgi:hypothetical protein
LFVAYPENSSLRPRGKYGTFSIGGRQGGLVNTEPIQDRDEIVVCMLLAFCIGNALITLVYRLVA